MTCKNFSIVFLFFSLFIFSCKTNNEITTENELDCEGLVEVTATEEKGSISDLPLELMDYEPGVWSGGAFSSKWYGFNFTGLSSMKTISEEELIEINAQQSLIFDGPATRVLSYKDMQIVYEVISTTEDQSTVICVLAEKAFTDTVTTEDYATILMNELQVTHGRNIAFEECSYTQIGERDYYTLTAKINIDGQIHYKTIFLRKKNQRFATILFDYRDRNQFTELLGCFTPFED